jgi:hypothetical protein
MIVIKRGSIGPLVSFAQERLRALGYDIAVDGDFGNNTQRAVRALQRSRGLKVDGVVGEKTWLQLAMPPSSGVTVSEGDSGPLVVLAKELIEQRGESVSDGDVFQNLDVVSLMSIQLAAGLPVTGQFDDATWQLVSSRLIIDGDHYISDKVSDNLDIAVPKNLSVKEITQMFGSFKHVYTGSGPLKRGIKIVDGWDIRNITTFIPTHPGDLPFKSMRVHKLLVPQLTALFDEWYNDGLYKYILSYAGAFYPRRIDAARKKLSNHSWGTAFDINSEYNRRGQRPAPKGEKGSVYNLVPAAVKHGFTWGGVWVNNPDGMHFEAYEIV